MEISSEADAMYIHVQPSGTQVKRSDTTLAPGVVVDLGTDDTVVGVEFLGVTGRSLLDNVKKVIDKYISPVYGAPSQLEPVMGLRLTHLAQIGWKLK